MTQVPSASLVSSATGRACSIVTVLAMVLVAAVVAVTGAAACHTAATEAPAMPTPSLQFIDGPTLDAPDLLAILGAPSGAHRALRLPVVVDFQDEHRLGIHAAWLGVLADAAPPGALLLRLDDSGLGIALLDQLRAACPPGRTCAVWIECTWGARVAAPPATVSDGAVRHDVSVLRFDGLQTAPATHVQLAK